jgi:hypothetical protein
LDLVTFAELKTHQNQLQNDPDFASEFYQLLDMSDVATLIANNVMFRRVHSSPMQIWGEPPGTTLVECPPYGKAHERVRVAPQAAGKYFRRLPDIELGWESQLRLFSSHS